MAIWRRLESWLSWFPWYRRQARDADLARELRDHLDLEAEEQRAAGLSPEEAAYAAHRALGNMLMIEEDVRAARGFQWFETLIQDLRFGFRMLRKSPGFTLVAILTLALGIGATASIFSVVDAVLLRPLPYRDSGRLVSLYEDRSSSGFPRRDFTPANYVDCKKQKQIFKDVAAIDERSYNLTSTGAAPERIWAEGVSWNLFSILGVRPLIGRVFRPQEDIPGNEHVVLLSHRLWRSRFGGDTNVVGQDIFLSGEKFTIVGVMPSGFSFPKKNTDLWVPIALTPQGLTSRGEHFLTVVAALQQGVSVARANAELRAFCQQLRQQYMDIMQFVDGFVAVPLQEVYTGQLRAGLIVLLVAVAFTLLIACANIANLLLSRASARQREIALRTALGAARGRVLRQLLTESAVLATVGGALGLLLGVASFSFLKNLIPEDLSRTVSLTLNLPVLAFTSLVSLASTVLFGLAPALQVSNVDVNDSLKESGRSGTGARRKNLGNLLVVGEIAVSLLLLIASGLLLRSVLNLRGSNPGFRSYDVLTAHIALSGTKYQDFARRSQFYQSVLERVRALPGVRTAGLTSVLPLTKNGLMIGFLPEGAVRQEISYGALNRVVTPGYFETMRIPLLRGRLFDERDGPDAPSVAIVNETTARKFWPNESPLGKRFWLDRGHENSREFQIVGIVDDVKQMGMDQPTKEEMYFPYWQANGNYMWPNDLVVRTTSDPTSLASAIRQAVWSVDPNQPVSDITTMDDFLDREVQPRRVQALLLGGLAALALTLACVGIYGVMAYLVAQQNHEIGVRAALGASPRDIFALVLSRGAKLTIAGVSLGIIAALLSTRLIRSLLFGVSTFDPLTFASVVLVLMLVALAACYIPARRAMRVDPMIALRYE